MPSKRTVVVWSSGVERKCDFCVDSQNSNKENYSSEKVIPPTFRSKEEQWQHTDVFSFYGIIRDVDGLIELKWEPSRWQWLRKLGRSSDRYWRFFLVLMFLGSSTITIARPGNSTVADEITRSTTSQASRSTASKSSVIMCLLPWIIITSLLLAAAPTVSTYYSVVLTITSASYCRQDSCPHGQYYYEGFVITVNTTSNYTIRSNGLLNHSDISSTILSTQMIHHWICYSTMMMMQGLINPCYWCCYERWPTFVLVATTYTEFQTGAFPVILGGPAAVSMPLMNVTGQWWHVSPQWLWMMGPLR